jgi:hypothetical protein
MGFLSTADFFYSLRFLRLLTTPWNKTKAFELGVLDDNGVVIKKPETSEEKGSYTLFHKLVFNLKRLLNKIPLGKSTLASYAAALYLIKENTNMSDKAISKVLKNATGIDISQIDLTEHIEDKWYLVNESNCIQESSYTLLRDIALPITGAVLAKSNTSIIVKEHAPVGHIFGIAVYEATHIKTKQKIYITRGDITR